MSKVVFLLLAIAAASVVADDGRDREAMYRGPPHHGMRTKPDQIVSGGGIYVHVLGRSGRMSVGKNPHPETDPDAIRVNFDSIRELAADESVIRKIEHLIQNDFAISAPMVFDANGTVQFEFSTSLRNGANLTIQTQIFKLSHTVQNGPNETITIAKGTVKFNFVVANYPFCGTVQTNQKYIQNCQDKVGAFLDVIVQIQGRKTVSKDRDEDVDDKGHEVETGDHQGPPKPHHEDPARLLFLADDKARDNENRKRGKNRHGQRWTAGNAEVVFSTTVNIDDSWVDMPAGYPMSILRENKQAFIYRFPKFTRYAYYDPAIYLSGPGNADAAISRSAGFVLACLASLMAIFLR